MRRRLTIFGVFLLLGAVTNIAVAWISAISVMAEANWGAPPGYRGGGRWGVADRFPYFAWAVIEHSTRTATQIQSWWYDPDVVIDLDGDWPMTPPEPLVPEWATFLTPPTNPTTGQQHQRILDVRGWPMRSMWSVASYDGPVSNNMSYVIAHGIPLPQRTGAAGNTYWPAAHALPLRIRWPGFIVNTLCYATTWFVVVHAPVWAARWHRQRRECRRHGCPRCGYPIGVSPVCTECGCGLQGMNLQQDRGSNIASTAASRPGGAA